MPALDRSSPAPPAMGCRTCGAVLDRYADRTEPGRVRWLHPARPVPWDHQPDPAPTTELAEVAAVCDFCNAPYALITCASAPVSSVLQAGGLERVHEFGQLWTACANCALLLDAGDPERLWRHTIARIGWSARDPVAQAIRELHATVVANLRPQRGLITTVRWPPALLRPQNLPKIRDRLATLLDPSSRYLLAAPPLDNPGPRRHITAGLRQARLYWIDPEFTELTRHATTSLPPTAPQITHVPVPHGLMLWAEPVGAHRVDAASWTSAADGWDVVLYRGFGAGLDPAVLQPIREDLGWLLPVDHVHLSPQDPIAADHPAAPLLVAWLLIAQRLAETSPLPVPRAVQRAQARTGRPAPEVRLVRVRPRRTSPPNRHHQATDSAAPAANVRVWITGYWRQQPHGPESSLRTLTPAIPARRSCAALGATPPSPGTAGGGGEPPTALVPSWPDRRPTHRRVGTPRGAVTRPQRCVLPARPPERPE
jgi:hypothetical protein